MSGLTSLIIVRVSVDDLFSSNAPLNVPSFVVRYRRLPSGDDNKRFTREIELKPHLPG